MSGTVPERGAPVDGGMRDGPVRRSGHAPSRAARFAGVSIAAALVVTIWAPALLSAQIAPYLGVSGVWASMPEPYALDTCGKGGDQLFGVGVDVGVRRGAVSLELGYRSGSQREKELCVVDPFPLDDRTRIDDRYLRSEREELDLLRSRIGYTLGFAPRVGVELFVLAWGSSG